MSFLMMELLEGETIEKRLRNGALSSDQTVRYRAQIADALAKAHKKGSRHRRTISQMSQLRRISRGHASSGNRAARRNSQCPTPYSPGQVMLSLAAAFT
jgi:hypothetical protein